MPEQPLIYDRAAARAASPHGRLAPAGLPDVAWLLLAVGLVLALVGWTDVALLYYPPFFGNNEWEFGVVAQTFDALPTSTVAMLLLAVGLRARGGRPIPTRLFGVLCGVIMLVIVGLLVIFLLDVPIAWKAITRVPPGGQRNLMAIAGLKRGIAKVGAYGVGYAACYAVMAVMMWRAGRLTGAPRH